MSLEKNLLFFYQRKRINVSMRNPLVQEAFKNTPVVILLNDHAKIKYTE